MKKIYFLLIFQLLYASEMDFNQSLYKDYNVQQDENSIDRIGAKVGMSYMITDGIAYKKGFNFDKDVTRIGTRFDLSYILYKPNDIFDFSANVGWDFVEPSYMNLWDLGVGGRYYINNNNILAFKYAFAKQGKVGKDGVELGTGTLWGIGYEYRLNNNFRFFIDYKKATLSGEYFEDPRDFELQNIDYNVNTFSVGLGLNFDSNNDSKINHLNSNGSIEDMKIAVGWGSNNFDMKITDGQTTLKYPRKTNDTTAIVIKSKPNFFNKSETLGYKWFSLGFDLYDYSKRAGRFYLLNTPEEITGHSFYLTPSIFYTNNINNDFRWEAEFSLGAGLLTIDSKNINSLDVNNQLGLFSALSTEITYLDLLSLKCSYTNQKYNNHGIKYDIDGFSYIVFVNFKFKSIFDKDW